MSKKKPNSVVFPNHERGLYLTSLEVENLRCFGERQVLDLTDHEGNPAKWTVLLGDNGTGKTTILQSLGLLTFRENGSFSSLPLFSDSFFPLREKDFPAQLLIQSEELYRSLTIPGGSESGTLGLVQGEFALKLAEQLPPVLGYGAERKSGSVDLTRSLSKQVSWSLYGEEATLLNPEQWLIQSDYRMKAHDTKRVRREFEQVKELLIDLLPDVTDLSIHVAEDATQGSHVKFKTHYGWVRLEGLSLGYRTLIAWMVDLAARQFAAHPDSSNPLAEPAIVLVDELDLHLHPRWQRTIIDYLDERFPHTQFIVTAHSPLVVQANQNANLAVMRREGDQVVIENDVEYVRNWRVDQILTSDVFGLNTARPPAFERMLERRSELVSKKKLTKKQKEELAGIEEALEGIPIGDNPEDIETAELIRRTAKLLNLS